MLMFKPKFKINKVILIAAAKGAIKGALCAGLTLFMTRLVVAPLFGYSVPLFVETIIMINLAMITPTPILKTSKR